MAGAPTGNKNAARGTEWRDAIKRAIDNWPEDRTEEMASKRRGLNAAAYRFVDQMMSEANIAFFKEFGDRLDGKAANQLELSGPDGEAIEISKIERVIKDSHKP